MPSSGFINEVHELFIEPSEISKQSITERLKKQKERVINLVKNSRCSIQGHSKNNRPIELYTLKKNIGDIYEVLDSCIDKFMNGKFRGAQDDIKNEFIKENNYKFLKVYSKINRNEIYYRVRSNSTYKFYKKNEMFHIPFEKRGLVNNQRYSISGYPCLYLGSSAYGCWEATGRPDTEKFNIVAIKARKEFVLLDLRIPKSLYEINETLFAADIYTLILSLACSLKCSNNNDPFKPEYIIPQIILNLVMEDEELGLSIDGIIYTSNTAYQKDSLFRLKDLLVHTKLFDNIVIPIKKSNKEGLCEDLVKGFTMTEPTSMLKEELTRDITLPSSPNPGWNIYERTKWGKLERKLKRGKFGPIK